MQRSHKNLLLVVLALVVCCFQACTGCDGGARFGAVSSPASLAEESGGDGRPIQGKPDPGSYYRIVPGYQCANQLRVHSHVEVTPSSITLYTLDESTCTEKASTLLFDGVSSSRLSPRLLTQGAEIYEKLEQAPDATKLALPITEALCTIRLSDEAYDLSVATNQSTGLTDLAITGARLQNGSWVLGAPEKQTVTRETSDIKLSYSSSGLRLNVDRLNRLTSKTFAGAVSGSYAARVLNAPVECRIAGWYDRQTLVQPRFALDFSGGTLPPSVSYVRAGSATYFDSKGMVTVAGPNVPRLEFDPSSSQPLGLLIEESRTNLALSADNLTVSPWEALHLNVVKDGKLAGIDRYRIEKNDPTALDAYWRAHQWVQTTAGHDYTASFFIERGNTAQGRVMIFRVSNNEAAILIDLNTGNLQQGYTNIMDIRSFSSRPVGTGYRVSVTFHAQTTDLMSIGVGPDTTQLGDYVYATGAQLEEGTSSTSFIFTAAAPVTRNEDQVSVANVGWFNGSQGTLQLNVSRPFASAASSTATAEALSLTNAAADSYSLVLPAASTFQAQLAVGGRTSSWSVAQAPASGLSALQRILFGYSTGNFVLSLNGQSAAGPANAPLGLTPTVLNLGGPIAQKWNGHVKSFTYWPVRLSDPVLQSLD